MTKRIKNIGVTPETEMKLRVQAAKAGISYKLFCEEILEHQAKNEIISIRPRKKRKVVKLKKEKTPETTPIPITQKEVTTENNDNFTTEEKRGVFKRHEPNIYTNGKIWQYRRIENNELKETLYKTLEELKEAAKL